MTGENRNFRREVRWALPLAALFAGFQIWLGLGPIREFAPTYDEPVHITAGTVALKTGNYKYNGFHHPILGELIPAIPVVLAGASLPLVHRAWRSQVWSALDQYQFADYFFYRNKISHEKILALARSSQLGVSVLATFLFFTAGFLFGSAWAGILFAGLWAFSPTALAHGTLATTDLVFSVSFFLFFVLVQRVDFRWSALMAGAALGVCFASKYPAILILPISLGIVFLVWVQRGGLSRPGKVLSDILRGLPWKNLVLSALTALIVLSAVYQFSGLSIFWEGLAKIFTRAQTARSSFFMGDHSTTGWLSYFPVAFLIKTPLIVLAALAASFFVWFKGSRKIDWVLAAPPLLYFAAACLSKVQIGHRHILPLYPFVFYFIALQLGRNTKGRAPALLALTVLIPLAVVSASVRPNFLSFFNAAAGGGKNGYTWLTDSNVDWGQGLKPLGQWLDERDSDEPIYLSYFGVADPHAYGIRYISVGSDAIAGHADDRESLEMAPDLFAISATNLQATYFEDKTVFDWAKKRQPLAVLNDSLFIYDFSEDDEAQQILTRLSGWQPQRKMN